MDNWLIFYGQLMFSYCYNESYPTGKKQYKICLLSLTEVTSDTSSALESIQVSLN